MPNGMVKNSIKYVTLSGLPDVKIYQDLVNLYDEIFKDADIPFFKKRIEEHVKLFSVLAYDDNILVGFKIGYSYSENTFYSWIGGVKEEFRRKGIGCQLAFLQEQWVRHNGFTILRTKSMNRFKAMMISNLKNGFDIIKVYTNTKGQTKIVFEKKLD